MEMGHKADKDKERTDMDQVLMECKDPPAVPTEYPPTAGPRRRRLRRSAPHWSEPAVRARRRVVARLRDPCVALLASANLLGRRLGGGAGRVDD